MHDQTTITGNTGDLDPEACRRARLRRQPALEEPESMKSPQPIIHHQPPQSPQPMTNPQPIHARLLATPIGTLRLVSDGESLIGIEFEGRYGSGAGVLAGSDPALDACARQLSEYFAGSRRSFDLPMAPVGTVFQRSVWAALAAIPYGELHSYRDIARAIGRPAATRAVGAANGRNPLPIVVPCHRVVGSDGSLTGFAGGLEIKRQLLQLEGALPGA
jgi:methylated-DNA-[protein]-cysteine S-methyltransferase